MAGGPLPAPMLPTLADAPFDSDDWIFELKWDGVRAICQVTRAGVTALSRTGKDLMRQFPELSDLRGSFARLPVIVDGEIVSLDRKGRSSFQRLQARLNRTRPNDDTDAVRVNFVVFDVLRQGATDLRDRPTQERKSRLEALLQDGDGFVLCSKHVIGSGKRLFAQAARLGVEGIVAKRRAAPYRSGRSRDWLKIKTVMRQEFVIVGWTEPRGSRDHIGALLVGYYDDGALTYAGHVGTGFDSDTLSDLHRRLAPLATTRRPLSPAPKTNSPAHWVRPHLVAEIKFGEWTRDGILRQPVYVGLRNDKRPKDCIREQPAAHRGSRK